MYINEVGHDEKFCQNILAREKDDRIVHYYLYLQKPIKKGETVELLTNYGDHYEETRERRGYGKANIQHGLKGNSDENARMRRNMSERKNVEDTINSMAMEEIEPTIEFLLTKIFLPLASRIESFFQIKSQIQGTIKDTFVQKKHLSVRQWKAWRRLSWMTTIFRDRVDTLLIKTQKDVFRYYSKERVHLINYRIKRMKWRLSKPMMGMIKDIKADSGRTILDEIHSEIMEENLFIVSKGNALSHMFDSSLWCAIARKLVKDIAEKTIATYILEKPFPIANQHVERLKRLATDLENLAVKAVSDIRDACRVLHSSASTSFEFNRAVQSLALIEFQDMKHQQEALRAYQEVLELGCILECVDVEDYEFPWHASSIMLRTVKTNLTPNENNIVTAGIFSKTLCDINALRCETARIDENWYLLWQIVRVVHGFATECVCWDIRGQSTSESIYSFDRLCEKVGIQIEDARKMLSQKIVSSHSNSKACSAAGKRSKKEAQSFAAEKKPKKESQISTAEKNPKKKPQRIIVSCQYDKSDGTLPEGWYIEFKKRLVGKHIDKYWYTKTRKKLRSRVEVKIFLEKLADTNDEDIAYELLYEEKDRMRLERIKESNFS